MEHLLTIAFLFAVATGSAFGAEPPHPSELGLAPPYFEPVHGTPEPRKWGDRHEPECAEYFRLGTGVSGTVFRLHRGPEEIVTRKDYSNDDTRDSDHFLLTQYRKAQETGLDPGFSIPKTWTEYRDDGEWPTGKNYLYFEPIYGRALSAVLSDPSIDPAVKAWLEHDYERRFARWKAFVTTHWQGREVAEYTQGYERLRERVLAKLAESPDSLPDNYCLRYPFQWYQVTIDYTPERSFGRASLTQMLVLKADAIVVDSRTLEMYLVDPQ